MPKMKIKNHFNYLKKLFILLKKPLKAVIPGRR